MNIEQDKINKIIDLCKQHKVKELYMFGSALNDHFNSLSDIDFLIEFICVDVADYFDNFMDFKNKLETLLD